MDDTLFDEQTAARYLGGPDRPISCRTLQRWRLEGYGPEFCKIGRAIRYRKSSLDTYLSGATRQSTSQAMAA